MKLQGYQLYYESANDTTVQYIPVSDIGTSLLYDTDFPIVCEHQDIPYQQNVYDQDALEDHILYGHMMYAGVPSQQIMHVQEVAHHENSQLVQEVQLVEQDIDDDALRPNQMDDALNAGPGAAFQDVVLIAELPSEDSGCSESDPGDVDNDDSFVSFHSDEDLDYDPDFWPESDTDSGVHRMY